MNIVNINDYKTKVTPSIEVQYDGVRFILTWKNTGKQVILSKEEGAIIHNFIDILLKGPKK